MTPEQLIYDLQKQVLRLEQELEEANKDIRDFEKLAIEWKKGHRELLALHEIEKKHADLILKELQEELMDFKEARDYRD